MIDQRGGVARDHARLLRFLAGIDLQEQARTFARLLPFGRQRVRQLDAVQGLNHIEQRRRLLDLVGL